MKNIPPTVEETLITSPLELQTVLRSEAFTELVRRTAIPEGISAGDIDYIELEVAMVILGLTDIEDLPTNIQDAIPGIFDEKADSLALKLLSDVISPTLKDAFPDNQTVNGAPVLGKSFVPLTSSADIPRVVVPPPPPPPLQTLPKKHLEEAPIARPREQTQVPQSSVAPKEDSSLLGKNLSTKQHIQSETVAVVQSNESGGGDPYRESVE